MNIEFEWIGFAGIALSVVAYLPQVIHLIRERCSAGLSAWAYCMWMAAAVLLLVYAIMRDDPVFISLQSYQAGACALILYYCVKYRGQFCEDHGGEPLKVGLQRERTNSEA